MQECTNTTTTTKKKQRAVVERAFKCKEKTCQFDCGTVYGGHSK